VRAIFVGEGGKQQFRKEFCPFARQTGIPISGGSTSATHTSFSEMLTVTNSPFEPRKLISQGQENHLIPVGVMKQGPSCHCHDGENFDLGLQLRGHMLKFWHIHPRQRFGLWRLRPLSRLLDGGWRLLSSRTQAIGRVPHAWKLILFGLLSVADFAFTRHLVDRSEGTIYESNPLAEICLASLGWTGVALFKTLGVLLVASTALFVSCRRPRLGGGILHLGCAATGSVVLYSGYLALHGSSFTSLARDARAAEYASRGLEDDRRSEMNYQALLRELSNDFIAGRRSFLQVVTQLAKSEKVQNPFWIDLLRQTYRDRTDLECVALHLAFHTLDLVDHDPTLISEITRRLESDFRAAFGKEMSLEILRTDSTSPELTKAPWPGREVM
jgi:hypothetical protein